MRTIRELFKIGNGPSSSHTMGPKRASELFKDKNPDADRFEIILYGSLALTGKGHLTDYIIRETFKNKLVDIFFDDKTRCTVHPNTMDLIAYKDDEQIDFWKVYSVGGGAIEIDGQKNIERIPIVYNHSRFSEIKRYCLESEIDLAKYVYMKEDESFREYLWEIWNTMKTSVEEGLMQDGILPGFLRLERKAKRVYENVLENEPPEIRKRRLLLAYAYAVSEMNSSGGVIVTSPTCGAAGVLPAVLKYLKIKKRLTKKQIIDALCVAGLIGGVVRENASISGAFAGCQSEIGTACSMASAAASYLFKGSLEEIECAAEMALEHHLGLTCDPVSGLVQIPCIERNAAAALRALDNASLAPYLSTSRKISFDVIVKTMYETGLDLKTEYKETSTGGLAKLYKNK